MSMPRVPGVAGVDRPEELVRLQHQLAAEAVLVVDDERPDAGAAELDGRRQPGRPAADDEALAVDRGDVAQLPGRLNVRELRLALERGHAHAGPDRAPCTTSPPGRRRRPSTGRTGRSRRKSPGPRRPCGDGRRRARRWRRAPRRWSRRRGPCRACRSRRTPPCHGRAAAGWGAGGCGTRPRESLLGPDARRSGGGGSCTAVPDGPGQQGEISRGEPTGRGRCCCGF